MSNNVLVCLHTLAHTHHRTRRHTIMSAVTNDTLAALSTTDAAAWAATIKTTRAAVEAVTTAALAAKTCAKPDAQTMSSVATAMTVLTFIRTLPTSDGNTAHRHLQSGVRVAAGVRDHVLRCVFAGDNGRDAGDSSSLSKQKQDATLRRLVSALVQHVPLAVADAAATDTANVVWCDVLLALLTHACDSLALQTRLSAVRSVVGDDKSKTTLGHLLYPQLDALIRFLDDDARAAHDAATGAATRTAERVLVLANALTRVRWAASTLAADPTTTALLSMLVHAVSHKYQYGHSDGVDADTYGGLTTGAATGSCEAHALRTLCELVVQAHHDAQCDAATCPIDVAADNAAAAVEGATDHTGVVFDDADEYKDVTANVELVKKTATSMLAWLEERGDVFDRAFRQMHHLMTVYGAAFSARFAFDFVNTTTVASLWCYGAQQRTIARPAKQRDAFLQRVAQTCQLAIKHPWKRELNAVGGELGPLVSAEASELCTDFLGRVSMPAHIWKQCLSMMPNVRKHERKLATVKSERLCSMCNAAESTLAAAEDGKAGVMSACGGCERALYCTRACQVNDWKRGHKNMCRKDKVKKPVPGATGNADKKKKAGNKK